MSFPQDHREASLRQMRTIFGPRKNCRDLRIETLSDAVANRFISRWRESIGSTSVDELDRIVVDDDARQNIAYGKITMNDRIRDRFDDRIQMVVRAGLCRRI